MIRGVRGQYLRWFLLAQLLHAIPEIHRSFRIVAALRHHHEADVVGFGFVFPRRWHREEEVEEHLARVERNIKER